MDAKPFLKWAGGKTALLGQLLPLVPRVFGCYYEPFLGGGAVYFALAGLKQKGEIKFTGAYLSDLNEELINAYQVVRDDVTGLLGWLGKFQVSHSKEFYYQLRNWCPITPVERAARFVYLNRTCFNGLYRVNKLGEFNVPVGNYKNPKICDEENLRLCSHVLADAELGCAPFERILDRATTGDFVYFDPPYVPISATANFVSYTPDGFGWTDQERLASVVRELDRRGCQVMVSNAWVESLQQLYTGFRLVEVRAPRAINSKGNARGKVSEMLVLNY
jgi:DNA adenine methylase